MWEQGRQGTGYLKRLLLRGKTWDLYLLKYPEGSYIPAHKDPVPGFEHHRINIVLIKPKAGGQFWMENIPETAKRFIYFRSDITTHGIKKIERGTRWVLSFGWIRKAVDDV